MTSDLKSSQDAVALLNKKNVQLESELIAAKSQATGLRTQLQEHERLIERLQRAAHREPSRAAAAAEVAPAPVPAVQAQPEPPPATPVTVDEFASLRIPPAAALRAGALFGGDGRWKIYGAAVVLAVLMLAVWSYVHQKPATASAAAPAAAVAAVPHPDRASRGPLQTRIGPGGPRGAVREAVALGIDCASLRHVDKSRHGG
jgi:hypothetical protein